MLWTDLEPGDVIRFRQDVDLEFELDISSDCDCEWCVKQKRCLKKKKLVVKNINTYTGELILNAEGVTTFYMDDETFKKCVEIVELVEDK